MEHPYIDQMGEQEAANSETGLSLELKNLKTISRSDIKESVMTIITSIQDGWADENEAHALSIKGREYFTELEKNIRPLIESKGIAKDYCNSGVKYTEGMTGVKYDYSTCGDPVWNELNEKSIKLAEEIKNRQTFLSSLSKPMEIVINEAEVYKIKPPIKSGKLGFKCEIQ